MFGLDKNQSLLFSTLRGSEGTRGIFRLRRKCASHKGSVSALRAWIRRDSGHFSPAAKNHCCHQCLHWWRQCATGTLHFKFEFLGSTYQKKERISCGYPFLFWWIRRDSNPRPLGCEPNALPAELRTHLHFCCIIIAHSSEKSTVIFVAPPIFFQNFTG